MRTLLIILLCLSPLAAQESLPDLVDRIKDRVVNITVFDEEGELGGGSGFIAEGGLIVTNAHVVEGGTRFEVCWDASVSRRRFAAEVVAIDEDIDIDLAVLAPLGEVDLPAGLPVASDAEVRLGEDVVILGFPWLTQDEEIEVYSLAVFRGIVTSIRWARRKKIKRVVLDANILSGASGAPVYAPALGKVVAVAAEVEMSYFDEEEMGSEEYEDGGSSDVERIGIGCAPGEVLRLLKEARERETVAPGR